MLHLPPLENLRFFEAAARHQSFALAGKELGVTAAAVGHRIRTLEKHLDAELFERRRRSVRLNPKRPGLSQGGAAHPRRGPRRLRATALHPTAGAHRLGRGGGRRSGSCRGSPRSRRPTPASPSSSRPTTASVDPARRDFDAWLAYAGETSAPRPLTRREDTLLEETLYEEALLPVCSPALLVARGRPRGPAELHDWPLLYDLGWDADWSYWFARQGQPTPDLSRASGFRLYSMLIQAAASGLGAAIGRPMLIAHELERRVLVPLFERQEEAPERCCLITTAASRQRPELRAFRNWILREAALPPPAAPGFPRYP